MGGGKGGLRILGVEVLVFYLGGRGGGGGVALGFEGFRVLGFEGLRV